MQKKKKKKTNGGLAIDSMNQAVYKLGVPVGCGG
jgi:hypothetical protein